VKGIASPATGAWRRFAHLGAAACIAHGAGLFASPVLAEDTGGYPARAIRIVVPFAAGTQLDIAARLIGAKLAHAMGQPVTIDDRPGGAGNIASEIVAKSPPDGYTILASGSLIALLPSVIGTRAVDPATSFAPILRFGQPPMLIVTNPSLDAATLPELIALARRQPGRIAYSTPGVGTGQHLAMVMLSRRAGIELLHVPYANASQALKDVLSGEVPVFITYLGAVEPFLRNGQLKPLAVVTGKRVSSWPELPTVAETGYADFEVDSWNILVAPAGTPKAIIDRLYREVARIVQEADVREQFLIMGMEPSTSTPEQLAATIRTAVARFARIARDAGIQPD
jgi:tripartite-type tricarboxylate transporter receptor subunit TctC